MIPLSSPNKDYGQLADAPHLQLNCTASANSSLKLCFRPQEIPLRCVRHMQFDMLAGVGDHVD